MTTVPETLRFLNGQMRFMQTRGFDCSAISSPGPMLDEFGAEEAVATVPIEMQRRITPAADLRAVRRLSRHFRATRPAIVHAHTPKAGLLGMMAAWKTGVPLRIYHIHGLPLMTARGWKRRLLCQTERLACSLAHQVLCVSRSIREVVVQEGLCAPHRIKVIGDGTINGIDAETRFNPLRLGAGVRTQGRARLGIPINARVIGFVGRIVRDKGLIELVEAWRRLRIEAPDLNLVVVGPFESQDPVPDDVRHLLQHDPRVHLTGPEWDVAPLYALMDLLVLPTYREGFPYVPMEAAAMTLPVVATRVPGCVDAVVDGRTGTLVPACDASALADAIRAYLNDPRLRLSHGIAGRERVVRDFQPVRLWEATYGEYAALMLDRGLRIPEFVPARNQLRREAA